MIYNEKDMMVFESLKAYCLEQLKSAPTENVSKLAVGMMDSADVPMHHPFHHFIVPAALLTAAASDRSLGADRLEDMLDEAILRSINVVGGACGNWGACGAAIGAGIFVSIFSDSSPLSVKSWGWANEVTGRCLQEIAHYEGPRCCKRTVYLTLRTAVPYVNRKLELSLTYDVAQTCHFSDRNQECKQDDCPFYVEN